MLAERDAGLVNEVEVSSAGFFSKKLKDQLISAHIRFLDPFYKRPMAEAIRAALLRRGDEERTGEVM